MTSDSSLISNKAPQRTRRPQTIFLTFAAGPNYTTHYLVEDVRRLGLFDAIRAYGPQDLGSDFWSRHKDFIEANRKGFGFWVWKPYIIKRELEKLQEDDILVWSDAGAIVLAPEQASAKLQASLQRVWKLPVGLVAGPPEGRMRLRQYCKQDVFADLGISNDERDRMRHYNSNRILARKHAPSMRIINAWAAIAWSQRYHLFDNSRKHMPYVADFVRHKHDQAVLSIPMNRYGGSYWKEANEIFFRVKRLKNLAPQWLSRTELPPDHAEKPAHIQRRQAALLAWAKARRAAAPARQRAS